MDAIEVLTISDVSSERSATPTEEPVAIEPEPAKTPAIHFGSDTEPFFFLSNSFPSRITFHDHEFANAEAIFQAAKFHKHEGLQLAIAKTKSPEDVLNKAQYWSHHVPKDWAERCLPIMKEVQMLKYTQNDQLRARLLQTGDAELIYTTDADDYFGYDKDGQGQNHLGKILMSVRALLRIVPEPSQLSNCFKLKASHGSSCSTIWSTSHASEQWYPPSGTVLTDLMIEPAIEDAPASQPAFLHSIVHGSKPWTLYILVQVRQVRGWVRGNSEGPWVHFYSHGDRRGQYDIQVKLCSEILKATAKGGADVFIYRVHVCLPRYATKMDIRILPNMSVEGFYRPDHTLIVKTAAAE